MTAMSFGKYQGRPVSEVVNEDPAYVAWACTTNAFKAFLAENQLAVRVVQIQPGGELNVEILNPEKFAGMKISFTHHSRKPSLRE